jgi:hypothetical protein
MQQRKRATITWMAASICIALALVAAARWTMPAGDRLSGALRATARWSFVLFWLGYTGNSLNGLFGTRFKALAQHGRDFGLSFAAAHLVHLGLVAWLLRISETPFPRQPLVFFGIAVIWIYLLALLSIERISAQLGPRTCKTLRSIGVQYIALAFLVDFAKNPFGLGRRHLVTYLLLLALALAGPLLRLAAAIKRLGQSRRFATP